MKVTKRDLQETREGSPLELFRQGIRAQETLAKYTSTLRRILCKVLEDILQGTFEERAAQLVQEGKKDPGMVRDILLIISKKQRERTELPRNHPDYFNPSSMRNFFKPIKKLLDMNDINLNWKRIYSTFPELDNVEEGHGWTRDEIREMLKFCTGPIDRAIILVAASSGIRVGGFGLKWGDVRPIYHDGDGGLSFERGSEVACATISVYGGTNSAYPAFITPEAYRALLDYARLWEKEAGRAPEPEDPVFKKSRNGRGVAPAGNLLLKNRVTKVAVKAGFRVPDRKKERRFDVPIMNGFRRFWNKTCKEATSRDSPLASLIKKEYMMGHAGITSLDRNYFQARTLELAEEYMGAVPALTMDESEELRQMNRAKDEVIRKLSDEKDARIMRLEEMMAELLSRGYGDQRRPPRPLLDPGRSGKRLPGS